MTISALLIIVIFGLASFLFISKKTNLNGFYLGSMDNNKEPDLLTITFSLVTTWIFSRSLLTAATLAYYYGLPGALAYTTYYCSFLTGCYFILSVRKKYKVSSILEFFNREYGLLGKLTYSTIVIVRLVSEIFANLIVIGLIFGIEGSIKYNLSITLLMILAFSYSYLGGFRNSIKTDFFQMIVFLLLFLLLISNFFFTSNSIDVDLMFNKITNFSNPGYALIGVALLQIWSYPIHDPVMTDRGFICNNDKTKKSFVLAFLLSASCIFIFSLLGIYLSKSSLESISFFTAIKLNLGEIVSYIVFLLLIVSAMSTLDSTLSSASKLIVLDLKLMKKNILNGRLIMFIFSILGLTFIFFNTKDLFTAVAVSGTAATFLTTTFVIKILFNMHVSKASLLISFILSVLGSILYYLESQGINNYVSQCLSIEHKYNTLLVINVFILILSFVSVFMFKSRTKLKNS